MIWKFNANVVIFNDISKKNMLLFLSIFPFLQGYFMCETLVLYVSFFIVNSKISPIFVHCNIQNLSDNLYCIVQIIA